MRRGHKAAKTVQSCSDTMTASRLGERERDRERERDNQPKAFLCLFSWEQLSFGGVPGTQHAATLGVNRKVLLETCSDTVARCVEPRQGSRQGTHHHVPLAVAHQNRRGTVLL